MVMTSIKKILLAVAVLINIGLIVNAQPQSLYFLRTVPQSTQLNPAFQPTCNFYLGLPGGNIFANAGNKSLSLNSFLRNINGTMTTAFDSAHGFKDDFYKAFKPGNIIVSNVSVGILNFGLRLNRDWYFTYDLNLKSNSVFSYPKEFAKLAIYGNAPSNEESSLTIPLKNFGANSNTYIEHAFGLSKTISDELTVGGKIKILQGIANFSFKNQSNATLTASTEEWRLNKPLQAHAATLIPDLATPGANGEYEKNPKYKDNAELTKEGTKAGNLFKNMGLGIDLGMEYKPSDIWSFSASIIDLGFIRWKSNNAYSFTHNSDSVFEGVFVSPRILTDQKGKPTISQATLDTLLKTFTNQMKGYDLSGGEAYTSFLSWKFYAGASCFIWPEKLNIGVLTRTEMYFRRIYEQVTISTNFFPARCISATASYSIMNNGFSSMGFGMNLKAGPFNMFFVGDYWPLVYGVSGVPYKTRMVNAQLGFNLLFGCGRKIKDRPMIESY